MKSNSNHTKARVFQHNHRHRMGSLTACIGLLEWHMKNHKEMSQSVRARISAAQYELIKALDAETKNNEFMNYASYMKKVAGVK
jgi:hypothetical protein